MVDSIVSESEIAENIRCVRERIRAAAERSGRSADAVTLVGVSKYHPLPALLAAVRCGIKILGESRVQEAEQKREQWTGAPVLWHMIGHLQRNKARRALDLFDRIQSVDNFALAETLNRILEEKEKQEYPILIEVNQSGEDSKNGVPPDQAESLFNRIQSFCPYLRIEGAMTIGPLAGGPDAARPVFARFREQVEQLRVHCGLPLPELSMGMSGDFEQAIEEGSTLVRVGTALFGARES